MATDKKPTWEELMGSGDWVGLLDPILHSDLRDLILRCGNFSQATRDAFNNNGGSKYYGSSTYGKESFFEKVVLESASLYQVYAFLYASVNLVSIIPNERPEGSWDRDSNMIGYIAVTTDAVSKVLGRREIYVAWRGTITGPEWVNNFDIRLVSAKELLHDEEPPEKVPNVMSGWLNIYTSNNSKSAFTNLSPRDQLRKKIKELVKKDYKGENLSIIVTGHSLGASLATLSAFDLVENDIKDIHVAAIVSASPHVGDEVFKERVENNYPNLKVLRTFNIPDPVPYLPQLEDGSYKAVGVELKIDNNKSPYLNFKRDLNIIEPFLQHDLQGQMHTVRGWIGMTEPFDKKNVEGHLALVNKNGDLLKRTYLIPNRWWAAKNKGMIHDENGKWILVQDEPVPEKFIDVDEKI